YVAVFLCYYGYKNSNWITGSRTKSRGFTLYAQSKSEYRKAIRVGKIKTNTKIMKRVLFSALLGMSLLFTSQVNAQKLNIGINGAAALPLGDIADDTDFGFGGDLTLDYYFNDKFDLG